MLRDSSLQFLFEQQFCGGDFLEKISRRFAEHQQSGSEQPFANESERCEFRRRFHRRPLNERFSQESGQVGRPDEAERREARSRAGPADGFPWLEVRRGADQEDGDDKCMCDRFLIISSFQLFNSLYFGSPIFNVRLLLALTHAVGD